MTARLSAGVALLAALIVALALACEGVTVVTDPPGTGTLHVPVVMDSGVPPDSGFDVVVDDSLRKRVHPPDTTVFELAAGDHTVELQNTDGTAVEASASIQHLALNENSDGRD